ncbi:MAG: arsenic resistance N-acetyltransferase ArsN2 [Pseudomonadota bacterium]
MLNSNISLRPATPSDWNAIAALLEANKLPLDGAQDHLSNYLLATNGPEIVGIAGAEVYGDIALLRSVAVAPTAQRQGVGKLLVTRLLEEAMRRQIGKVYLLSVTAPEYFAQYGFKRGSRDNAPQALKASAEFQGACPACAAFMSLTLIETPAINTQLPVAVLGAGPVGLAAAARLLERGIESILLEAGSQVGANLLEYGHVRLFSPWQYNIDPAMAKLLEPTGWTAPPASELPPARDIVEKVLQPFAALPEVARTLHLNTQVQSISREGFDKVKTAGRDEAPFVIHALQNGRPIAWRARAIIDATGTWNTPNPIGASGLPAQGEAALQDRIFYGIPDVLDQHRSRYAGKRTLVVGAGHSAANALLSLAELAKQSPNTRLAWTVRSPVLTRVFGGGTADALPARGQLGSSLKALRDQGALEFVSGLRITELRHENGGITVVGTGVGGKTSTLEGIDEIVCATGQRPNLAMTSELRLKLDPWLESTEALGPLIDPNVHSCGTVRPHGHRELAHPEQGYYSLGVKSYGRAPTFLMATGFEQARSVVAAIAGDMEAADRVELDLPETGVCGFDAANAVDSGSSCCGTPAPATVQAVEIAAPVPAKPRACCGTSSSGAPAKQPAATKTACCG